MDQDKLFDGASAPRHLRAPVAGEFRVALEFLLGKFQLVQVSIRLAQAIMSRLGKRVKPDGFEKLARGFLMIIPNRIEAAELESSVRKSRHQPQSALQGRLGGIEIRILPGGERIAKQGRPVAIKRGGILRVVLGEAGKAR